jgi:hypothetical protein
MPTSPLDRLFKLIEEGQIQESVTVKGVKYTFKSLNDEEYVWRDRFIDLTGPVAVMASAKAPTLAVATVAIDDTPVDNIPDLQPTEDLQDESAKRYAIADNLRKVYAKLPRVVLEKLYDFYLKNIEEPSRKISEDDLKNS